MVIVLVRPFLSVTKQQNKTKSRDSALTSELVKSLDGSDGQIKILALYSISNRNPNPSPDLNLNFNPNVNELVFRR